MPDGDKFVTAIYLAVEKLMRKTWAETTLSGAASVAIVRHSGDD